MPEEVKVTNEKILALWGETADARDKADRLLVEAKLFHAKAEYQKVLFWEAVGKEYGINLRSVIWTYDEETQTVIRSKKEEGHPLAKLFSVLQGAPIGLPDDPNKKDSSGTVV